MFKIAYGVADASISYQINRLILESDAFEKMRNGYAQVGLGVPNWN